jgi:molecular chaperone GrpE
MTSSHKPGNDRQSSSQSADKWQKIAEEAEKQALEEEGGQPQSPQPELELTTREQLEDQLNFMERQVNEYKQQAARAQAELENVRRRAERDIRDAHKYGVEQLIHALLPVVDGLVRGLESGDHADPKVQALHSGMQLTLDLLYKALAKVGVEIIDPAIGAAFDPKLHEAVGVQKIPGAAPNTVAQLLQKGCQLHGRVLRAAMVMVSA